MHAPCVNAVVAAGALRPDFPAIENSRDIKPLPQVDSGSIPVGAVYDGRPKTLGGHRPPLHLLLGAIAALVLFAIPLRAAAPVPTPAPNASTTPVEKAPALAAPAAPRPVMPAMIAGGWMQQSLNSDGVKITVALAADSVPRFGFIPFRVSVENALSRDLRWRVNFRTGVPVLSGSAEWQTEVVAPANRTSEQWVFVPTAEAGVVRGGNRFFRTPAGFMVSSNCTVVFDGPIVPDTVLNFGGRGFSMTPWAVSSSLESAVRSRIAALKAPLPKPPPPGTPAARRFRPPPGPQPLVPGGPNLTAFDVSQSLADWRIWAPFSRVILRADEYATLPPQNRVALRNWVALGGWLYLSPAVAAAYGQQPFGAGKIITLAQPIDDETDAAGLFEPSGLFGSTPAIPQSDELSMQKVGLTDKISPAKRVGDWLVYFFIGFAVLVAPINLYGIAPVKRRHWLFFSVPAISAAAVAILVVAIYAQDGVGGEGARRSLVTLLPGDNQAAVFQDQLSRTGLLFGSEFPLSDDTICAVAPADDPNFQPSRRLEFSRTDAIASGDWFRGRARQGQHLRRLVPTRARIEQVGRASNGAPIVQSSIGARLKDFFHVDAAGVPWHAEIISPGTPVTLLPVNGAGEYERRARVFSGLASAHFRQVVESAVVLPRPGRFLALADDSELAPIQTLTTIDWKDSTVMFAGVVEQTTRKAMP